MIAHRRSAVVLLLVLQGLSCGGDDMAHSSSRTVTAAVFVDGTVDAASAEELVIRDAEGRRVPILLEDADGPAAQFFRQTTNPNRGLTLSEAAPHNGEPLCVLARISTGGELVSWKVFLESHCQHVP